LKKVVYNRFQICIRQIWRQLYETGAASIAVSGLPFMKINFHLPFFSAILRSVENSPL